jgi:hypothetical protein
MLKQVGFYSIDILPSWEISIDENDIAQIVKEENGLGAMQISSFHIPPEYPFNLFDELVDFTSKYIDKNTDAYKPYNDLQIIPNGLMIDSIVEKEKQWVFAIIFSCNKAVLITYNSAIEDFYIELTSIKSMINSIKID